MRKWQSHKIVEAEQIKSMGPDRMANPSYFWIVLEGGEKLDDVSPDVFKRGYPVLGDYLVRYEDGYLSWSPKKAFEAGYILVET